MKGLQKAVGSRILQTRLLPGRRRTSANFVWLTLKDSQKVGSLNIGGFLFSKRSLRLCCSFSIFFLLSHNLFPNLFIIMKFTSAIALLACATSSLAFAPTLSFQRQTTSLNAGVLAPTTGTSSLDPAVIDKYNALPFPADSILAEYVWCDAVGNTRSKTRTLPKSKVCIFCIDL
jgi:hypothetical protein